MPANSRWDLIRRLRVNHFTTNWDIATKFEADLPHCVRNVKEKNVLLLKFRCNIFIGVRIIKKAGFGSEWDTL